MKKWLPIILGLLMLAWSSTALAATEITLDGKKLSLSQAPVVVDNYTLVPLRGITEAFGCEVTYDTDIRTIVMNQRGTSVSLPLDSDKAFVNAKAVKLDAPARSISGVTMVPLRFLAETFNMDVKYENGQITLTSGDYVKVHFIDVGDGEAIYIQLPNHQDVLIDAGDEKNVNSVLQCLRENNVDDIDLLIATHPHEGNIGGIPTILSKYKVKRVIESVAAESIPAYFKYRAALEAAGIKPEVADNQQIKFNGAKLDILASHRTGWERDTNGRSVASLLTVGNVNYLFMADVENNYDYLLDIPGQIEIIKAASQGGNNSTSQSFLDKTKPEVVVISVAKDNPFDFPHFDTIERIKNTGAGIVRTSTNGDITISTDGKKFSVVTTKNEIPEHKKRVEPPAKDGLYLGDINGDVFHWASCHYADKIRFNDRAWFKDAKHAKENGYQPCQFCQPQ